MSSPRPAPTSSGEVVEATQPAAADEVDGGEAGRASGIAPADLVLGAALTLVAVQSVLRVWMLWPSWFYGDDYALLGEADAGTALVEPYAGQFMPLGRLWAALVSDAGPLDWHATALSLVAASALAGLAVVWMLVELFGRRWGVLLPLGLYLTSAIVMPATMWWAAALNQLPLQAVLPAAVAAWVRYLRTGRRRWWVLATLLVGVGLLAYVKALLVVPVLAWITLAHFTSGGPVARLTGVVRRHWQPVVVLVGSAVGFLVWYVGYVPSIVSEGSRDPVASDLARSMLGTALPTGLLGGPWRWSTGNPPVALADPPDWAVAASWVALVLLGVGLAVRRRRTGRVWLLLGWYAASAYVLLLTTRAPLVGGLIGLEYRYLTDVAPVAALCLGLATLELRDADEPTEPRRSPSRRRLPSVITRAPLVVGLALAVSGLASSVSYARVWHDDHPGHAWFDQMRAGLAGAGDIDVADASVPDPVVPGLVSPWNTLGRLLPQAGIAASFPDVTTRVAHLTDAGTVSQGLVDPVVRAPAGPAEGCGYRLDGDSVTVRLDREVPPGVFWLRVGYLSSAADTVRVQAGEVDGSADVSKGLGSIFVNLAGGADSVTVSVGDGTTFCVGDVEAGPLVEGPPW